MLFLLLHETGGNWSLTWQLPSSEKWFQVVWCKCTYIWEVLAAFTIIIMYPNVGGSTILRNVHTLLPGHTVSHPRQNATVLIVTILRTPNLRLIHLFFSGKFITAVFITSSFSFLQSWYWYLLYTTVDVKRTSSTQDQMMMCVRTSLIMTMRVVARMTWQHLILHHCRYPLGAPCLKCLLNCPVSTTCLMTFVEEF